MDSKMLGRVKFSAVHYLNLAVGQRVRKSNAGSDNGKRFSMDYLVIDRPLVVNQGNKIKILLHLQPEEVSRPQPQQALWATFAPNQEGIISNLSIRDKLLIGTYNVHNTTRQELPSTKPKPETDIEAMATVIAKGNFDLLALQEVDVVSDPVDGSILSEPRKRQLFFINQQGMNNWYARIVDIPDNDAWRQRNSHRVENMDLFPEPPDSAENFLKGTALLDELNKRFWKDQYFILPFSTNSDRGMGQVILFRKSRFRLLRTMEFYHPVFKRGFVGALFKTKPMSDATIPEESLWVFTVHLKSLLGGKRAEAIRLEEAKKIREIINRLYQKEPQAKFIILGDFNEPHNGKAFDIILNGSPVVPALNKLFCVPNDQQTYCYNRPSKTHSALDNANYAIVDHIIVSATVQNQISELRAKTYGNFTRPGDPNGNPSDHRPVYVKFIPQTQALNVATNAFMQQVV